MAKIPTYVDVGRRGFTGSSRVVRQDTSNSDYGTRDLANSAAGIANYLGQERAKDNRLRVAQARSQYVTGMAELNNSFDQDPDYDTIVPRYTEKASELRDTAARTIDDPEARALFMANADVDLTRGREGMRDLAFGKLAQNERVTIAGQADAIIKSIGAGGVPPAEGLLLVQSMMTGATDEGYLTPEQAYTSIESFKSQAAVAGLSAMDPASRLAALDESWAQNLPASARSKLVATAAVEVREAAAIAFVDGAIASGLSRTETRKAIREVKDKDTRLAIEARYDDEIKREDAAQDEVRAEFNQEYFLPVRQGKMTVSQIPADVMAEMKRDDINALYTAQKNAGEGSGEGKDKTSRDAMMIMLSYRQRGDIVGARRYLLENTDKFSDGDYEQYLSEFTQAPKPDDATDLTLYDRAQGHIAAGDHDAARELVNKYPDKFSDTDAKGILRAANPKSPTVESLMTVNQRVEARILKMGVSGNKADELKTETVMDVAEWANGIQSSTGKRPTQAEINTEIDRRLVKDIRWNPPGFWAGGETRNPKDMTSADYDTVYELSSRDDRNAAVLALEARGEPVTRQSIVTEINR